MPVSRVTEEMDAAIVVSLLLGTELAAMVFLLEPCDVSEASSLFMGFYGQNSSPSTAQVEVELTGMIARGNKNEPFLNFSRNKLLSFAKIETCI